MTSSEQPEADALEQRQAIIDDPTDGANEEPPKLTEISIEADPVDAFEQHQIANVADDEDYPMD